MIHSSPLRFFLYCLAISTAFRLACSPCAFSQDTVSSPAASQHTPPLQAPQLQARPTQTPEEAAEALRLRRLPLVNGVPYHQPSAKDLALYYVHDTYELPGQANTALRATYGFSRDKPVEWGQDFPGYAQRFGSAEGVTVINGNVRLGLEFLFHEDLRYLPCHHCTFKHKLENAVLSEFTARHGEDGRRIFSLTPVISDFSGPVISHSTWSPEGFDPAAGLVASRVVAVTRIGIHMAQEYWGDRHHKREPK